MTPASILLLFVTLVTATARPSRQDHQLNLRRRHYNPGTILTPRVALSRREARGPGLNDGSEPNHSSQMQATPSTPQASMRQRHSSAPRIQAMGSTSTSNRKTSKLLSNTARTAAPSSAKSQSQRPDRSKYAAVPVAARQATALGVGAGSLAMAGTLLAGASMINPAGAVAVMAASAGMSTYAALHAAKAIKNEGEYGLTSRRGQLKKLL